MASHSRHVLSRPGEVRHQVKFARHDLLWEHHGPLRNPHAAGMLAWAESHPDAGKPVVEVPGLPLRTPSGNLVGPTILDLVTREIRQLADLPKATARAARDTARAEGRPPPVSAAIWTRRDPATLWPRPGQDRRAVAAREADADEKEVDHPFLPSLASGGSPAGGGPPGWVRVEKATTVLIGEYCYRLGVGMCGGLEAAYSRIGELARAAWEQDETRALEIWELIGAAPDGLLVEDERVLSLRPGSSISQQVERELMRQACVWLGIDPELDLRRPRGRPRARAGDEGEVISVSVDGDGTVTGLFRRAYLGVTEGTALADLDILKLAEVLGGFRHDGLGFDADLLEAYLDTAAADWRERVAAAAGHAQPAAGESPCDVLGVLPDTPWEQVVVAFRAAMQAVANLPNAAPQRRLITAYKALKTEREPT